MRTDIDSIVREVEANGVCVVPDFIPRDLLAHIKEHVDRLNVAERESGRGFIESEGANQRVFNLVNKGEVFEQIVQHDDVMHVMNKLLGGDTVEKAVGAQIKALQKAVDDKDRAAFTAAFDAKTTKDALRARP